MKSISLIRAGILALATAGSGAMAQSYEFSNCGANGADGPAQGDCNTAYTGTSLDGMVTVTGGIQRWTVPATGTYRLQIAGASGGDSIAGTNGTFVGGGGAEVIGDFDLSAGEQLDIIVGQEGTTPPTAPSGDPLAGGGGGTFVWKVAGTDLMIAAGGGGGAGDGYADDSDGNGADATVSDAGSLVAGLLPCVSLATPGEGWTTASYTCGGYHAGGGAGWNSNGVINALTCDGTATNALSPLNGGTGGNGNNDLEPETGPGGFGGGGGSATECGSTGGGGGGGYTGGGAVGCSASDECGSGGGGGGSFNAGANPQGTAGANEGNGSVIIRALAVSVDAPPGPALPVPVFSPWALMGLVSLLGGAGLLARRRRSRG